MISYEIKRQSEDCVPLHLEVLFQKMFRADYIYPHCCYDHYAKGAVH